MRGIRQEGSGDLESIGCYQSTDYSAMKEVKSGTTGCQQTDLYTVRDEHVLVKSHRDSNGHVSIVNGGRVTNK